MKKLSNILLNRYLTINFEPPLTKKKNIILRESSLISIYVDKHESLN